VGGKDKGRGKRNGEEKRTRQREKEEEEKKRGTRPMLDIDKSRTDRLVGGVGGGGLRGKRAIKHVIGHKQKREAHGTKQGRTVWGNRGYHRGETPYSRG